MRYAVDKVRACGNSNVAVTDRGTMFGYGDLVVDFRGVPEMHEACGTPVIVDCTHSAAAQHCRMELPVAAPN